MQSAEIQSQIDELEARNVELRARQLHKRLAETAEAIQYIQSKMVEYDISLEDLGLAFHMKMRNSTDAPRRPWYRLSHS